MKKVFAILALTVAISACKKEQGNPGKQEPGQPESQIKKPGPPPPNANPAFAFQDYFTQGNRSIPGIFVMDVTGANKTKVYSNYTNQTTNTPDFPAWSGDGTKLCFTLNSADLYTLNITVVNGVPTGSNPTKIGDGVAGGGSYKQGKWIPGQNQVACVWKKTGDPDKIHLLSASGGTPTVLYTALSTDWIIENDIAAKADGSILVFSERQVSTGNVYLKTLDVSSGQVTKTIDMGQFSIYVPQFSSTVHVSRIAELDWAKSSGSNMVALTAIPQCDTGIVAHNSMHQLCTIDVGAVSPALNWQHSDFGNISFSPNDLQITVNAGLGRVCGGTGCCSSSYFGIGIYTIATNTYYSFPTNCSCSGGNHHDWKR